MPRSEDRPQETGAWLPAPAPAPSVVKTVAPIIVPTTYVVNKQSAVVSDVGIPEEELSPVTLEKLIAYKRAVNATPAGMTLYSVQKDFAQTPAQTGRETVGTPVYVATYTPEFEKVWSDTPVLSWIFPQLTRPTTSEERAALQKQYVEGTIKYESLTERTAIRLGASSVIVGAALAPSLAVGAIGGIAVGTGIKVGTTGKGLTMGETVMAAGIGQLAAMGASAVNQGVVQPRVSKGLSESYEQAAKAGSLWEPTTGERFLMKVTGAKPSGYASGLVDIPLPKQSAGKLLAVDYDVDMGVFEMGIAPRSSSYMVTDLPAGIRTGGLPKFYGKGEMLVPALTELYLIEPKPKTGVGVTGGETKLFSRGGSMIQVWAGQPSKVFYSTAPQSFMQGFTKTTQRSVTVGGSGMAPLLGSIGASTVTTTITTGKRGGLSYTPTVTLPETRTKQAQKQEQLLIPTFQQYPQTRQRAREEQEQIFYTMPGEVARLTPSTVTVPITVPKIAEVQIQSPYPIWRQPKQQEVTAFPKIKPLEGIFTSPKAIQSEIAIQKSILTPSITTKTIQGITGRTRTRNQPFGFNVSVPKMAVPRGFGFPRGSNPLLGNRKSKDLFGKWTPRTHAVKTPLQMLKTFGFSSKKTVRRKHRR